MSTRSVRDPDTGSFDPIEEMTYQTPVNCDDPPDRREVRSQRRRRERERERERERQPSWSDRITDLYDGSDTEYDTGQADGDDGEVYAADSKSLMSLSTMDTTTFRRLRENRRENLRKERRKAGDGGGRSRAAVKADSDRERGSPGRSRRSAGSDDTHVTGHHSNHGKSRGGLSSRAGRKSGRGRHYDEESAASSSYHTNGSTTAASRDNERSTYSRVRSRRPRRRLRRYLPWQTVALFALGLALMVKMGVIELRLERNQLRYLRGGEEVDALNYRGDQRRAETGGGPSSNGDGREGGEDDGAKDKKKASDDKNDAMDALLGEDEGGDGGDGEEEGEGIEYSKAVGPTDDKPPPPPPPLPEDADASPDGKGDADALSAAVEKVKSIVGGDTPSEKIFRQQLEQIVGRMDAAGGGADAADDDPAEKQPPQQLKMPQEGQQGVTSFGEEPRSNRMDDNGAFAGQVPQQQQQQFPNANLISDMERQADLLDPNQKMYGRTIDDHSSMHPPAPFQRPELANQAWQQQLPNGVDDRPRVESENLSRWHIPPPLQPRTTAGGAAGTNDAGMQGTGVQGLEGGQGWGSSGITSQQQPLAQQPQALQLQSQQAQAQLPQAQQQQQQPPQFQQALQLQQPQPTQQQQYQQHQQPQQPESFIQQQSPTGGQLPVGEVIAGGQLPPPSTGEVIVGGQLPPPSSGEAIVGGQLPPPSSSETIAEGQLPPPSSGAAIAGQQAWQIPMGDQTQPDTAGSVLNLDGNNVGGSDMSMGADATGLLLADGHSPETGSVLAGTPGHQQGQAEEVPGSDQFQVQAQQLSLQQPQQGLQQQALEQQAQQQQEQPQQALQQRQQLQQELQQEIQQLQQPLQALTQSLGGQDGTPPEPPGIEEQLRNLPLFPQVHDRRRGHGPEQEEQQQEEGQALQEQTLQDTSMQGQTLQGQTLQGQTLQGQTLQEQTLQEQTLQEQTLQEQTQLESLQQQQQGQFSSQANGDNHEQQQQQQQQQTAEDAGGSQPNDQGVPAAAIISNTGPYLRPNENSSGMIGEATEGADKSDGEGNVGAEAGTLLDPFGNDSRTFRRQPPAHLFTDEEKAQLAMSGGIQGTGGGSVVEGNGLDNSDVEQINDSEEQGEKGGNKEEEESDAGDQIKVNNDPKTKKKCKTRKCVAAERKKQKLEPEEEPPADLEEEPQAEMEPKGEVEPNAETQEDTQIRPRSIYNDGVENDNPRLWGVTRV